MAVRELGLSLTEVPVTSDHRCYRPPSWPPPTDWVVSEDLQGKPISLWGDDIWDFSAWAGISFKLDFAGGRNAQSASPLGPQNQYLMRLLATWMIWGPRGSRAWRTLRNRFGSLRRIVALCEREGIVASNLMRHPRLLNQLPALITSTKEGQRIIVTLDRLLRDKDQLGFTLVDQSGIGSLSKTFAKCPEDETEQTAYIPPRIWTYQVLRLSECLEEFLKHRQQIEDCYNFAVDAYAHNFGSLEVALSETATISSSYRPFTEQGKANPGARTGRLFYGPFELTAQRFGIAQLLEKWVLPSSESLSIKSLSAYLTLVQYAGLAYIPNFTLQRIEEAATLRADCLVFEEDPVVGRIPMICGETTKTDPDSDARWPTSPSITLAVDAMAAVAKLRMRCAIANPDVNCSQTDRENPLLCHRAFEPWATSRSIEYSTRPNTDNYQKVMQRYPRLFDPEQLRITEDDLSMARMFTPNLSKGGKFKVGAIWPLAYHQLRRTGAVNMFASRLLSDSSIQMLMKHRTVLQAVYYGRNHTRLRVNEEVEGMTTQAKYEVMAKQIQALVSDRYVSPAGPQRKQEIVVNLIGPKDFKTLIVAGKVGDVSFRETRLGGCAKPGHCDYGGIESVARCTGGDGDKPCREALYDRMMESSIELETKSVEQLLQTVQPGSPRERALQADQQGLRNYLDVVRN